MIKKVIGTVKNNFTLFCVSSISLYALFLRLVKLSRHALWGDERFQLEVMGGSFLDMLKLLPTREFCSYLSGDFYLIYPFFKLFGYNKWGLAIPHIISTVVGFYLLYQICKIYFKTIWGYLITFSVVCFNATLIWHATEIRTYAVLPTLALAVFYLAHQLVRENRGMSLARKYAIGAFFVLVIWFHLYGIFMPYLSVAFLLLTVRKEAYFKRAFVYLIKFMSVVSLVAMPLWVYSVFGPRVALGPQFNIDTYLYIPNPMRDIVGFLKGIFGNLIGYKKFYFLLAGMFFPFLIKKDSTRFYKIIFVVFMVFVPITVLFLAAVKNQYYFVQRQFIWVMPFFAFFLGWVWDSFFYFKVRKLLGKKS